MPNKNRTKLDAVARIMAKVVTASSGCILWLGAVDRDGYGYVRINGKNMRVHRAIYSLTVAEIPVGLQVDHLCHHPSECSDGSSCQHRRCCNPKHLQVVTPIENMRRGHGTVPATKARKHQIANGPRPNSCPKGHEYTDANTYRNHRKSGGYSIQCRECKRLWIKTVRAKRAEVAQ